MSERIGIFGGTFDPIHVAHLAVAAAAFEQLALDRVVFVIAGMPYQKTGQQVVSPAGARLEMVEAAIGGRAGFEVSDLEIRRGGPSYMIDTLLELQRPARALFLILGGDVVSQLDTWHRHSEIPHYASLAVATRSGVGADLAPRSWPAYDVAVPHLDLSSSELRAMAGNGRTLEFLVPYPVLSVIVKHDLYRFDPTLSEVPTAHHH